MKKFIIFIMIFAAGMMLLAQTQTDPDRLIAEVDKKRSVSSSYSTLIDIVTTEKNEIIETNLMRVLTKVNDSGYSKSAAFFLKPDNQKGRKLLLIGIDTWLYIPGADKAIKISPAQKLSGNASTGDVLSASYRNDYTPVMLGIEKTGNAVCHKMELTAKNHMVTYFKIILFIETGTSRPVYAEYYTKSGQLLKTAVFKNYQTVLDCDVFTECVITDAVMKDRITVIKYKEFRNQNINDSFFNMDLLKDLVF